MTALLARVAHRGRALRAAAWLGFQIESNWTQPMVWLVFALAKPLALGLILLAMYKAVIGGSTADPRFVGLFVGNAFYVFVPLLLVGLSWAIFEDREQYQMLKYVYTTPVGMMTYLLGRSLVKLLMSTLSCIALLVFGVLVLHVRLHVTPASLAILAVSVPVGVVGIVAVGLLLAGCSLVFARQSMTINEGAAAVLYLFSGAVFPPDILPLPLRVLALATPLTYWIESSRRALVGSGFSKLLGRFSAPELLALEIAMTAVWIVGGVAAYRHLDRKAQRDGKLDQTTAW